jgi:hypothetical protein
VAIAAIRLGGIGTRSRRGAVLASHGAVWLAVAGSVALLSWQLPVSDLQAAHARAQAFGNGAGTYWFSWFGGDLPGSYSLLTPAITSSLGASLTAGGSVIAIAWLAGALLRESPHPTAGRYAVVLAALANCASGRVAFCLGSACALAGLLALLRGHPWWGGVLNGLAAAVTALPTAFVLLALGGVFVTSQSWRGRIMRFAAPSAVGLLVGPLLFGAPGPMDFDLGTLLKLIVIGLVLLLVARPAFLRAGVALSLAACVALYLVPNGVGENIDRYLVYCLPPLVLATARGRLRWIAVALVPVVAYSAAQLGREVAAAHAPSASRAYYQPLERYLFAQPDRHQYRVEVLDTPTHRGSVELARSSYLARGWESQTDRADNPIFHTAGELTGPSYRRWLAGLAVGWVAVPDDLNSANRSEAALIASRLPYLVLVDTERHWTIYRVAEATPLVSPPAEVVSADPAELVVELPANTDVVIRVRPAAYLKIAPSAATGAAGSAVLRPDGPTSVRVRATAAGQYRLTGRLTADGLMSSIQRWLR